MKQPALAELQRWSEEVARDPGAPSFVPLARAYRRQGRREAAIRVCLRGLKRNATHVDAHTLLALLYLETGDREKAGDEWSTVLRLDPSSFEAHRGLGFLKFERGDLSGARLHLEMATEARPQDTAVAEALQLLDSHEAAGRAGPASGTAPPGEPEPEPKPEPGSEGDEAGSLAPAGEGGRVSVRDPDRVFDPIIGESPLQGAVILDRQGMVLAGTFARNGDDRTEVLGASVGAALEEAERTSRHLGLGRWSGLLVETASATIHLTPLDGEFAVLLAVQPDAPAGWVVRTAERAAGLARSFLDSGWDGQP